MAGCGYQALFKKPCLRKMSTQERHRDSQGREIFEDRRVQSQALGVVDRRKTTVQYT